MLRLMLQAVDAALILKCVVHRSFVYGVQSFRRLSATPWCSVGLHLETTFAISLAVFRLGNVPVIDEVALGGCVLGSCIHVASVLSLVLVLFPWVHAAALLA